MTFFSNKKTRKHVSMSGGKVIASGGFGCVFNPGLKCDKVIKTTLKKRKNAKDEMKTNTESVSSSNSITKLMKTKYAEREYAEIVKYRVMLKKIPDYEKFFLVDGFTLCEPSPLTSRDLIDFDNKCSALKKIGINSDNVNKSLHKLRSINMPYGGVELGDFMQKNQYNSDILIQLNLSLIQLLVKGIFLMNIHGVYHCDLKASNILTLIENDEIIPRIIDWGLSTSYHKGENVPNVLVNRPFQFNAPFSNVLFTNEFKQLYSSFLKNTDKPSYHTTRTFVINYVLSWIETRGIGHLKTINAIFKELYENDLTVENSNYKTNLIEFDYTFYHIFEYITHVLLKFTHSGHFDEKKYLYDVYLKNADIWGFVISYIPLIEIIRTRNLQSDDNLDKIIKIIRDMIIILVEHSDTPIDIHRIVEKLHDLNIYLPFMNKISNAVMYKNKQSSSYDLTTDDFLKNGTKKKALFSAGSINDNPDTKNLKKESRTMEFKNHIKRIHRQHSMNAWM